jgi:hypothetical protein
VAKRGQQFGASRTATSLLILFIPSVDRDSRGIDQDTWVGKALDFLGITFGGATAFPKARGVWRDDERGGKLVFDEPVVVQCYVSSRVIEREARNLRRFLVEMGEATRQGAVGFVIDREYLEIRFALED